MHTSDRHPFCLVLRVLLSFAFIYARLYVPLTLSAQYCSPAPHSAITPHGVPTGYGIPGISWNLSIALLHKNITECISNLHTLVDSGGKRAVVLSGGGGDSHGGA